MSKNIFEADFKVPSREDWEAKIFSDLSIDSLEKLQTKSYEDIIIDPIYTNTDRSSRSSDIHEILKHAKVHGNHWLSGQMISGKSSQKIKELLKDQKEFDVKATYLSNGSTFNHFHIPFNSKAALNDSIKDYNDALFFDFQELNSLYMDWIKPHNKSTMTFVFDAFYLYEFSKDKDLFDFQLETQKKCFEKENYRIAITTQSFSKFGCTAIQELTYTLSQVVEIVEHFKERYSVSDILKKIDILLPIGSNYFFEIAKFRAFRYLWQSMLESYNLKDINCRLYGISSAWNKSLYDSATNLLRLTTEAMSASIGSADMIFLTNYDIHTENSNSAQRYSANINNLLKDEAYIKEIVDASYGSYYIEAITEEMIEKSYQDFLKIEEDKGFLKFIESNKLSDIIQTINSLKKKDLKTTKVKSLGTNLHPTSNESKMIRYHSDIQYFKKHEIENALKSSTLDLTKVSRLEKNDLMSPSSKQFDLLRTTQCDLKIGIVCFGNKVFSKARVSFVNTLLNMINAEAEITDLENLNKFDCIFFCAGDDDYCELLDNEKLKTKRSQKRFIAGNLNNKNVYNLIHITDFAHSRMDHIEFLTQFIGGQSNE